MVFSCYRALVGDEQAKAPTPKKVARYHQAMRIVLIGYGKMGKTVERFSREQGHQIVHRMDIEDNPMQAGFSGEWTTLSDVIIDFSLAQAVPFNIENAVDAQIPIVVGTTGWNDQLDRLRQLVESRQGTCLYSSNFSLAVQMLFYLTRQAGKFLKQFKDYHPYLVETHHAEKVDAPSGTALTLGKILRDSYGRDIPVSSVRAGFFPGTHVVGFDSTEGTLVLEHTARNREAFAQGALFAAEWIQDRKGFYSFEDVIFGEKT